MKASQAAQASALAAGFTSEPEKRSEEQYRSSIDQWEERVRSEWQSALDELSSYLLDGVSVRVSNPTKVFFHDVEVKVHLEGDVRGVGWRGGSDVTISLSLDIPSPPREWGPVTRSPFSHSLMMNPSQYLGAPDFHSGYQSPLDWNNSGSVDLTLDVGELRPRQTFGSDDDELILILPRTSEGEVRGTWEITARDHNDIYTGELSVPVGESLDLTDSVRELLELD